MKYLIAPLMLAPALLWAHPDHETPPGSELKQPVFTGNGAWSYEAVPGWGDLPDKKPIGPTRGGVLIGPNQNVYLSTDNEMSIIVWDENGSFVKTIAPDCQGFHAMQLREEDGKTVIYGAQGN